MKTDPKRTAQACRAYAALLRYYPLSFQQEYGEPLAAHFRDEYHDVLASGKRLAVFRFWLFIVFDFISSLLMEVQEEGVKVFKKNFFAFSAIAAGIFTTIFFFFVTAHYTFISYRLNIPFWFQIFIFTLVIGSGSLTMFGITKVSGSHWFFRILCLVVLVTSLSFVPIPVGKDPFVGRQWSTAIEFLGGNEDNAITIPGYALLIAIIGIVTLIKRKWLPGALLLSMIILPISITVVGQLLPFEIEFLEYNRPNWYTTFFVIFSGIAWFVIAWWLKKENEEISLPETLETA